MSTIFKVILFLVLFFLFLPRIHLLRRNKCDYLKRMESMQRLLVWCLTKNSKKQTMLTSVWAVLRRDDPGSSDVGGEAFGERRSDQDLFS